MGPEERVPVAVSEGWKKISQSTAGLEPAIARSVVWRLIHWATRTVLTLEDVVFLVRVGDGGEISYMKKWSKMCFKPVPPWLGSFGFAFHSWAQSRQFTCFPAFSSCSCLRTDAHASCAGMTACW